MSEPTPEQRAEELYFEADVRDGKERWVRVVAAAIRAATAASDQARRQAEAERDEANAALSMVKAERDEAIAVTEHYCAAWKKAEAERDAARAGGEQMRLIVSHASAILIPLSRAEDGEEAIYQKPKAAHWWEHEAKAALADHDASAYAAWVDGMMLALEPFATWADRWNPSWPDNVAIDETKLDEPCPTLGDCRAARAALAARPGA